MDIIYEIKRRHSVQKQSFSAIAREMGLSRPTIRKHLTTVEQPKYERLLTVSPRLDEFKGQLTSWLRRLSTYLPQKPCCSWSARRMVVALIPCACHFKMAFR